MPVRTALADPQFNLKHISTIPHLFFQLFQTCTEDPDSRHDISTAIEKDPALTQRILNLVNTSYFRNIKYISSLDNTASFLDTTAIRNLSICGIITEIFQTLTPETGSELKQFWAHSLRCATVAKLIARKQHFPDPDEAFLSGMLHDIGKIILWVNFPQPYADLMGKLKNRPELILAGENRFGANHAEIGAWLLEKWKFPSLVVDSVRYHHDLPERISDALPLVKFIFVANALSRISGSKSHEGLEVAREIFGFTLPIVEEILSQADFELNMIAESFKPIMAPSESRDPPLSENDMEIEINLIQETENPHLILLTAIENLLTAADEPEIWGQTFKGIQNLLDIPTILFFISDPEINGLCTVTFPDNPQFLMAKGVVIPWQAKKSLIIECLQTRRITNSFTPPTDIALPIMDEQIIRLLGREGMVCIPMIAYGNKIGVVVLGLDSRQFSLLTSRINLLKTLVNQAAVAINCHHRNHAIIRPISSDSFGATSSLAQRVIHEINNPLGIIKNYLKILGIKLAAADIAQDEIRILNEEIDRVAQILSSLNGGFEDWVRKIETVDVNAVLSDILKIARESLLKYFNIQIQFNPDPGLPVIMADKNSLKQVFINLIKNAFEAMPAGGTLRIHTRRIAGRRNGKFYDTVCEHPEVVEIILSDDGPGIPARIKSRLTTPDASYERGRESGLGLSLVYHIIRVLKGSIICESQAGSGTTFRISLPAACSDSTLPKERSQ